MFFSQNSFNLHILFISGINDIWLISDILYPVTFKMNAVDL